MSAAPRNIILLPLVFLSGVWLGQNRLDTPQPDGQGQPEQAMTRNGSGQRTPFTGGGETAAKRQHRRMDHSGDEPAQAFSEMPDVMAPSDESGSESYSFYEEVALSNSALEPSPQSIENDIGRSLQEAGIPPEEIPDRVDNVMEMILQNDSQTPAEAYPNIPPDTDVPCVD